MKLAGDLDQRLSVGGNGRGAVFLACALLISLGLLTFPLVRAGFADDDWLWLAIARHLDSPLPAFYTGILHEYFYRPLYVAFWWFSERLFGTSPAGHYALDIALHGISAILLAALIRRQTGRLSAALLGGFAFVLAPAAIGTLVWLSNRNELLAVMFGLAFLLTLESGLGRPRRALAGAVLLMLAWTAKESAAIFVLAAGARLLLAYRQGLSVTAWHWPALIVPSLLAMIMRKVTVHPVSVGVTFESMMANAPAGISAWFERLPAAIGGFALGDVVAIIVAVALLASPILWLTTCLRQRRIEPALLTGMILLLGPALVQWPITHFVLTQADATSHLVNLRFYYLASSGLAIVIAAAAAGFDVRALRIGAYAIPALALAMSVPLSQRIIAGWVARTGESSRMALALATPVAAGQYPAGCRIVLEDSATRAGYVHYADAIVKAAAPRGASVLNCAVFTETAPYHAVLDRPSCSLRDWPGLETRHGEPYPLIRPYGDLCLVAFKRPDDFGPNTFAIRLGMP